MLANTIFAKKVSREKRIPFEVSVDPCAARIAFFHLYFCTRKEPDSNNSTCCGDGRDFREIQICLNRDS